MTVLVGLNLGTHVIVISDTRATAVDPRAFKTPFRDNACKRYFSDNAVTVYTGVRSISEKISEVVENISIESHDGLAGAIESVKKTSWEYEYEPRLFDKVGMISAINNDNSVELIYHNLGRFSNDGVVRRSGAVEPGKVCISYPGTITVQESELLNSRLQEVLDVFIAKYEGRLDPKVAPELAELALPVGRILAELAESKPEISSIFDFGVKSSTGLTMSGQIDFSSMVKFEVAEVKNGKTLSDDLELKL